jgi:uncharacterized protein YggT (Ycf19 family)
MVETSKPGSNNVAFIRIARGVTYFGYGFAIVACLFLIFGFFLLLFGANYSTPFVQFVYNGAETFLQPFRGIFATHKVSQTGYFNASALFASLMYLLFAMALHALINYLTAKIELYVPQNANLPQR